MCLAVPMKLVELDAEDMGVADFDGARCRVNLSMIENPAVGDYVIVHAGFAIERLDPVEADLRLELFAELAREGSERP